MLAHCQCLLGHLTGTETLWMFTTSVFLLLWQDVCCKKRPVLETQGPDHIGQINNSLKEIRHSSDRSAACTPAINHFQLTSLFHSLFAMLVSAYLWLGRKL